MASQEIKIQSLDDKTKKAWFSIAIFSVLVACSLTLGFSRYTLQLIPFLALLTGFYLYSINPPFYISFALWMHFVAPEIQRVIDYKIGTLNEGYLLFSANIVTLISIIAFLKNIPKIPVKESLPFVLPFAATIYSLFVSIVSSPPQDWILVDQFPSLVGPVVFGFYLYINWRSFPLYRNIFEKTFLWGTLFLGIYGLFQFVTAPAWDRHWLFAIKKWSYGLPEPFAIRIWSGTSDFQTYAVTAIIGLLILLYKFNWALRIPAVSITGLGILLTQARAAWLSGIIAFFIFISKLKSKTQVRVLMILVFLIAITLLLTFSNEAFYQTISNRLESLVSSGDDVSLNVRKDLYGSFFDSALSQVVGVGLAGNINLGGFVLSDAPLFIYLFYLGWLGLLPYFTGMFILIFNLCSSSAATEEYFVLFSQAFVIALIVMIGFNNILMGTMGVYFWSILSLGLAGCRYKNSFKITSLED